MPLSEEKIKMLKGRPQRTLKARLRKQNLSSKSVLLNLLGFTTLLQKTLDNLHQHFFPRDGCYWQLERASDIFFNQHPLLHNPQSLLWPEHRCQG